MRNNESGQFLAIIYLLLAIYLMPFFIGAGWEKDITTWATAASLVEHNSFDISWTKDLVGDNFANVIRKPNGAIYSTEPPAESVLAAAFYSMARVVIGPPTKGNVRTTWYVVRFLLATIPLILLMTWLLSHEVDSYSLAVLLFATPLFPFSLLLNASILASLLVYFSYRLLFDARHAAPSQSFNAGLMLGLALLADYAAFFPMLIFAIVLITTEPSDRPRRVLFYFVGILPAALILLGYNAYLFGSALAPLFDLQFASPLSILGSFISPARGLFFFSPVLLFSIFSMFVSPDRGMRRHKVKIATILFTALAVTLFESSNNVGIGAYSLIVIVPLLLDSFFDGEIEDYPSILRGFMLAVSMLFCAIPLLTYSFAPVELTFPHNSFWMPLMVDHKLFALTIFNTFGYPITFWTIFPAIFLLLLAIFCVVRDERFPLKFAVGIILGASCVSAYLFSTKLEPQKAAPYIKQVVETVGA